VISRRQPLRPAVVTIPSRGAGSPEFTARIYPPGLSSRPLTRRASCVYSALLRRVAQARRALSCLPAFWAWMPPIPLGMVAGPSGAAGFSRVSS